MRSRSYIVSVLCTVPQEIRFGDCATRMNAIPTNVQKRDRENDDADFLAPVNERPTDRQTKTAFPFYKVYNEKLDKVLPFLLKTFKS